MRGKCAELTRDAIAFWEKRCLDHVSHANWHRDNSFSLEWNRLSQLPPREFGAHKFPGETSFPIPSNSAMTAEDATIDLLRGCAGSAVWRFRRADLLLVNQPIGEFETSFADG
jgi:hypothetical protein